MLNAVWLILCHPSCCGNHRHRPGLLILFLNPEMTLGPASIFRWGWSRRLAQIERMPDSQCFVVIEMTFLYWLPWRQIPRTQLVPFPRKMYEFLIDDLNSLKACLGKKVIYIFWKSKEKHVIKFLRTMGRDFTWWSLFKIKIIKFIFVCVYVYCECVCYSTCMAVRGEPTNR